MNPSVSTSRPQSRGRVLRFRGQGLSLRTLPALLLVLIAVAAAWACSSGTVTTSTGAVVPAATVEAQDNVADLVAEMKEAYKKAVIAHDARAGTEDPVVHETHRKALLAFKAGLQGTSKALLASKQASASAAPLDVLRPCADSGRAFLTLAVDLGILKAERAQEIRVFLDAAFPPGGGA